MAFRIKYCQTNYLIQWPTKYGLTWLGHLPPTQSYLSSYVATHFSITRIQFTYKKQVSFDSLKKNTFPIFSISSMVLLIYSLTISYMHVFLPSLLTHILPHIMSAYHFHVCFVLFLLSDPLHLAKTTFQTWVMTWSTRTWVTRVWLHY